jgi:hypothetical protein
MEDTLNLKPAKVTYTVEEGDRKVTYVDDELTAQAQNLQNQLQQMFEDWLWSNKERESRLLRYYNDTYNNTRLRTYNGQLIYGGGAVDENGNPVIDPATGKQVENHVPIPGFANEVFQLRPHQKDAVWRMLQGKNTMLAHVVGAGKTLEMIVAAMEMRRLGIANKPMMAVPNKLVSQMQGDIYKAYPGARVLKLTSDDVPEVSPRKSKKETNAERAAKMEQNRLERAAILSKIATGDYDIILMSHDLFGRLPVSPERQQSYIQAQIAEIEEAIQSSDDKRTVKQLEEMKKKLEEKLSNRLDEDRKDMVLPFEELGIDQIFVDEAHLFKNLAFHTGMSNIAGLRFKASKRAEDMYMKTRWLTETRNGGGVVFATGTPIANTMGEMFNLQRYLAYDQLDDAGLTHFDAWAAMFGETTTDFEMTASGQFKARTRFAQFFNVPELLRMFFDFADVKTAQMLDLPKPSKVNRTNVVIPLSKGQKDYMMELVSRAENMKNMDPKVDNYLKLNTDGRKMAVDLRLVDPRAADDPTSKLNTVVNTVAQIYHDQSLAERIGKDGNPIGKHTQIVFMDLGTPKAESATTKKADTAPVTAAQPAHRQDDISAASLQNAPDAEEQHIDALYTDMKNKLIKQGIPAKEIAFIHDAKNEQQETQLYRAVQDGKIRVLIGNTQKMGAGVNVQDRLVALHHVDPTWRPADIEQREGRIIRQGNKNDEVTVYSYVTEGSFDALMWDLLRIKAQFISQMMNGDLETRSYEDVGDMVFGFAEIASSALGNDIMKRKLDTDKKVKQLTAEKTKFERDKRKAEEELQQIPRLIKNREDIIRQTESDLKAVHDSSGDKFRMTIDGVEYDKREEAGKKLQELEGQKHQLVPDFGSSRQIGQFGNFQILLRNTSGWPLQLQGPSGRMYEFPSTATPEGTAQSAERVFKDGLFGIKNIGEEAQRQITDLKKEIEDYTRIAQKTWDKYDELQQAVIQQVEIAREILQLNAANSNAASADTTANDDNSSEDDSGDTLGLAAPARSGGGRRSLPSVNTLHPSPSLSRHRSLCSRQRLPKRLPICSPTTLKR